MPSCRCRSFPCAVSPTGGTMFHTKRCLMVLCACRLWLVGSRRIPHAALLMLRFCTAREGRSGYLCLSCAIPGVGSVRTRSLSRRPLIPRRHRGARCRWLSTPPLNNVSRETTTVATVRTLMLSAGPTERVRSELDRTKTGTGRVVVSARNEGEAGMVEELDPRGVAFVRMRPRAMFHVKRPSGRSTKNRDERERASSSSNVVPCD